MTSTSQTAPEITAQGIAELLRESDHILVVSHVRPDGDCYGSASALLAALAAMGKTAAGYNASGVPEKLEFIPNVRMISDKLPSWTAALTVFVDCGSVDRVSPDFRPTGTVINIDHHSTNDRFGDWNYVDIACCAVGEQIFHILQALGTEFTRDIATSLYVSICADTGSFRYPNTNAETFRLAAELAALGADPGWVCRHLFESHRREEVRLTGRILERIQYAGGDKIAWSELRWPDYAEVGGEDFEPDGVGTTLRGIEGVEMSILFHELEDGGLRASLRGKGQLDCAAVAQEFGGGGHFNASGLYRAGVDYEKMRAEILAYASDLALRTT